MDIATKVVAWGFGAAIAGGLALFGLQFLLFVPYLDQMETLVAREKAAQAVALFQYEATTFARTTDDWSYWDDAVRFVAGTNPTFEGDNLYAGAFQAIRVDSMVFFRSDRSVVWSRQLSSDGRRLEPVPNLGEYTTLLEDIGALGREQGRQGSLAAAGGYDLVVVRPIQSDKHPGEAKGYLLMVRHLSTEFWRSFRPRMGLAVVAGPPSTRPDPLAVAVEASTQQTTMIRIPVPDVAGRVTLELVAHQPRTLETTGMSLLGQITWGSVVVLLLMTLGNLVFVRLTLIRPVRALWRLTLELEATSDWGLRASVHTYDEIGQLGRGINSLIASVQEKTGLLESLASQDALTGLANRRSFDAAIDQAWRLCHRQKQPLGFILADIDHFKLFNDRYGHRAGDACLKLVAQVIQDCALRPGDVKARYGGEEFALILPNTDAEGTRLVAERIRTHVEVVGLPHEDSLGHVTLSLGCQTVVPDHDSSYEQLIEEADRRLYQAKAAGRNRVVAGALEIPKP